MTDIKRLTNCEEDVYLWIEQDSSIMIKAATKQYNDPVELTADQARNLATLLVEAAAQLDQRV